MMDRFNLFNIKIIQYRCLGLERNIRDIMCVSALIVSTLVYSTSVLSNDFLEHTYVGIQGAYQIIDDGNYHDEIPDNDLAGLFLGYKVTNNLSVNLGYQYWGNIKNNDHDLDFDVINAAIRYDYYINSSVGLFGQVGTAYAIVDDAKNSNENYNSLSPLAEVGVSYWFTEKLSLGLSYQYLNGVGDRDKLDMDISSFNLSLIYNFKNGYKNNILLVKKSAKEIPAIQQLPAIIPLKGAVHFDFGSAKLQPKEKGNVKNLVDKISLCGYCEFNVTAYTDNIGTKEYNKRLSQQRANAIKKQLILLGINENSIIAEGLGESNPIASNDTEQGRAKNRRVELRVLSE